MFRRLPTFVLVALLLAAPATAQEKSIVVASTTSTEDSGLFRYLLPLFKAKTGTTVKVVALGTGQALDVGRRGDADVVFVHAKAEEDKFAGKSCQVSQCEPAVGTGVCRLAGLPGGSTCHRELQDQRPTTVLSQCRRSERMTLLVRIPS